MVFENSWQVFVPFQQLVIEVDDVGVSHKRGDNHGFLDLGCNLAETDVFKEGEDVEDVLLDRLVQ